MFKKALLFMSMLTLPLAGCAITADDNNDVSYISTPTFENVEECDNISAFIASVSNNKPDDVGVVISPLYSLKVNNVDIPVYAARSGHGVHSFAYVDVIDKDEGEFSLDVKITPLEENSVYEEDIKVDVLPLRHNIEASIVNDEIKASINKFGSFSFIFDEDYYEPITLLVAKKENVKELFEDENIKYILPGDYSTRQDYLHFNESNRVYYFKAGYYRVDSIEIPDNSTLYFEDGAYVTVLPNLSLKNPGLSNNGTNNIKVLGRGILDYSECCGGEEAQPMDKGGNIFKNVNNITIKGLTVINSQTWTLCLYNCDNVTINDVTLFSYRVFSDGVMLSGCRNALVERNFARTGDDGFEVKAAGATRVSENVIFQYNDCWTDKADAYGCVYETDQNIENVIFRHCSVGFAIASWSNHLGCICFQLGNNANDPKTIKNIKVDDIEIFKNENPAIINLYFGGYQGHYKGYGHIKDIYVSNVTCLHNENPSNTFVSFTNHLPEQGADVAKIGTFENINVSNIVSNEVKLDESNYSNGSYVVTSFYNGEGYTPPRLSDILHIRNGETYA